MKAVVAIDKEWGIGCKGGLLVHVRADLKRFYQLTVGKTVILGSKTLQTFPGGKVLKNRTNLILSRNPAFAVEGGTVFASIDALLSFLQEHPETDAVVIGGGTIYQQLLPYCDEVYVTQFDRVYEKDTYFPNLDSDPAWICAETGETLKSDPETDSEKDLTYRFLLYKRISPDNPTK